MPKLDFLRPDFEMTVFTESASVRFRVESIDYDPDDSDMQVLGRLVTGETVIVTESTSGVTIHRHGGEQQIDMIKMHDPATWTFDV